MYNFMVCQMLFGNSLKAMNAAMSMSFQILWLPNLTSASGERACTFAGLSFSSRHATQQPPPPARHLARVPNPRRDFARGAVQGRAHQRDLHGDLRPGRHAGALHPPAHQSRGVQGPGGRDGQSHARDGASAPQARGGGREGTHAARTHRGADARWRVLSQNARGGILADVCVHRARADVRGGGVAGAGVRGGTGVRGIPEPARGPAGQAAGRDDPELPQHAHALRGAARCSGRRQGEPRRRGGGRDQIRAETGTDSEHRAERAREETHPGANHAQRHEIQQRDARPRYAKGDVRRGPRHGDARQPALRFRRHGAHDDEPDDGGRTGSFQSADADADV